MTSDLHSTRVVQHDEALLVFCKSVVISAVGDDTGRFSFAGMETVNSKLFRWRFVRCMR